MKYLATLFIFCLLIASCKENYVTETEIKAAKGSNIPAVRVANVELTNAPIPIEASGTIGSKAEINLSFKIGGVIQNLYAKETQRVKKGQVLATLRTTEIDAQVMKAQQGVKKAERDLDRIKKMYADTAATLENVEDLTTRLNVAKSDLEIAQFNQQYAKIIAPVNGRVLKRFVENNELTGPGSPIFRIATKNGSGYALNIGVADKDVVRIKLGDQATVHFDAHPDTEFTANVTEIAEAADPRTGVFSIELTINAQSKKLLKNGFIGKVNLLPSNQANYVKIPIGALVEGYKEKANIYTLDGKIARKTSIRPLYIGADFFTIAENKMPNNQQVITDGAAYLKDGMKVNVVTNKPDKVAEVNR